jgi:hypothetical protein
MASSSPSHGLAAEAGRAARLLESAHSVEDGLALLLQLAQRTPPEAMGPLVAAALSPVLALSRPSLERRTPPTPRQDNAAVRRDVGSVDRVLVTVAS